MRQLGFLVERYIFVLGVPASVSIVISVAWAIGLIWFLDVIGLWVVGTVVALMMIGLVVHFHDLVVLLRRGYRSADVRRRFITLMQQYELHHKAKAAERLAADARRVTDGVDGERAHSDQHATERQPA